MEEEEEKKESQRDTKWERKIKKEKKDENIQAPTEKYKIK